MITGAVTMNIEYSHPLLPSFIAKEFDFQEKQDLMITWHSHEEIELIYETLESKY